ncbi:MAG: hypothetical protein LBH81_02360 [Rickettsiales bacterium]|jgi:hypothetical protein|nr:hypothetical protein [Rickettsiales bacterium]
MQKIRLALLSAITAIASFGAGFAAVPAAVVGLAGAAAGVVGLSVYRSFVATDTAAAFDFFSSCWSCRIFSGITGAMSDSAAAIYASLGEFTALLAIILTPIYLAWKLLGGYLSGKPETNAWKVGGGAGLHLVKLAFVSMLLLFPLPSLIGRTAVEPLMNLSLSFQSALGAANAESNINFDACLVASIALDNPERTQGVFSPGFKNKMRCSIAGLHALAATGMTAGWLLVNSAFDAKNFKFVIFPNFGMLALGFLLMLVYFWIIIPIALAFLEFVVKFAIDMLFLPLMLLGWLFKGNPFWDAKDEDMMGLINDVVKTAVGLGLLSIFLGFALMLAGYAIGGPGMMSLGEAFMANDSSMILNPDSLLNSHTVNLIFTGLFIAMFMTMMTELVKQITAEANIPSDLLKQVSSNTTALINSLKKFGKKKSAPAAPAGGTP